MAKKVYLAEFDARGNAYNKRLADAEKRTLTASQKIKGAWEKVGGAMIAAFGAYQLKNFMQQAIEKFGIQERAVKSLDVALGKHSSTLVEYAAELQRVTTYGDEQIIQAQALIAAFVKDESQIKKLTVATLDLATAKGMDLVAAADLISKTVGSSTNALSRYGIQVEGDVGSTKRLESVVKAISDLFGGQATAQAETYTGKMKQLNNVVGDIEEEIGRGLVPTLDKLNSLFMSINDTTGSSKGTVYWITRISTIIAAWPIEAISAIMDFIKGPEKTNYSEYMMYTYKQTGTEVKKHVKTINEIKEEIKGLNKDLGDTVYHSKDWYRIDNDIKKLEKQIGIEKENQVKHQAALNAELDKSIKYIDKAKEAQVVLPEPPSMHLIDYEYEKPEIDLIKEDMISATIDFGNALNAAFNSAGNSFIETLSRALIIALQIAKAIESSKGNTVGTLGILSSIIPGVGLIGSLFGLKHGGTITNYSGNLNFTTPPRFAKGTYSYIVPSGYPNDSYPIMVESGERIDVTSANKVKTENAYGKEILTAINNLIGLTATKSGKSAPLVAQVKLDAETIAMAVFKQMNKINRSGQDLTDL